LEIFDVTLVMSKQMPELRYPIDFRWFSDAVLAGKKGKLTSDAILLIYYGPYVGWQRYATSQAIFSLGLMQAWDDNRNEKTLNLLLSVTRSLVRLSQSTQTGSMGFPIAFKPLGYRLSTPWYSGLTQGFCASVFARAYTLTGDGAWLDYSKACLDFVLEMAGLACTSPNGGMWYEEAPTIPSPHILNGHVYCTIAFREVGLVANEEKYLLFFDKGVSALRDNLALFDAPNGLSYYDAVRKIPAKPYYQKLHVEQLKFLSAVTGYSIFDNYAARWGKQMTEKWRASTWFQYFKRTAICGVESDGISYLIKAFLYSLGDLGLRGR
jgi:hypothetical protein